MAAAQSKICVPIDDGAIAAAFEHLDAQMNEWLEAVNQLGTMLTEQSIFAVETPDASAPTEAEQVEASSIESASSTPVQSEVDDETLLASLDPETAKAIRVMRRLGSSRKSVRELLVEYQTRSKKQQPAPEQPTKSKKSWWRS